MKAVVYLSYTGHSKEAAVYLARLLSWPAIDLHCLKERSFEHLLFVSPVHAERLPEEADAFLREVRAEEMIVVAAYGRMNHGNAIRAAQEKYHLPLVGAAYFPTRHSYLADDDYEPPFGRLDHLPLAFGKGRFIVVPDSEDTPGRSFFPKLRARMGVKIIRGPSCDGCGACSKACPLSAIESGLVGSKCIRCLACLPSCPKGALSYRLAKPLAAYLGKKKKEEVLVYVGSPD